jgi:hypothetical protein
MERLLSVAALVEGMAHSSLNIGTGRSLNWPARNRRGGSLNQAQSKSPPIKRQNQIIALAVTKYVNIENIVVPTNVKIIK